MKVALHPAAPVLPPVHRVNPAVLLLVPQANPVVLLLAPLQVPLANQAVRPQVRAVPLPVPAVHPVPAVPPPVPVPVAHAKWVRRVIPVMSLAAAVRRQ